MGDRTVKLWDIKTGEELLTLGGYSGGLGDPRYSTDGRVLATISQGGPQNANEVFLWSAAEDEPQANQRPSINSPH
jgi:WD40 repeat protein